VTDLVKVAVQGELAPGERKHIDLDVATVVLFNVDGEYYCIEDVCTHDGGPLGDGALADHAIVCPRHGAMFDIRTGAVLAMPAVVPVPSYEVTLQGEDILIAVTPDTW
jgi:3-phenylpropionate/trans-cinnamate dioxygenase ferredoxin subunit